LVRKKARAGAREGGREGEGRERERREIWQIDEYFAGASVD